MRKIIFTEEEKERIKDLYINKNLSLISLSKEVGYSVPTLKNLLKDLNVLMHRKPKYDLDKDIIPLYLSGESLTKIAEKFKTDRHSLSRKLKERGIEIINLQNKTKFNENIFDVIDTEEKAYWLGFIYADGYIDSSPLEQNKKSYYKFELSLKASDSKHLDKFNSFMKHNKNNVKIGKVKCNEKICYRCRWGVANKHLWTVLNNYGCTPLKSLTLLFPDKSIFKDLSLIIHFIRGYFDGDGCISYVKHANGVYAGITSLLGTKEFLSEIQKYLVCPGIFEHCGKEYSEFTYKLLWSQKPTRLLLHELYENATIYLDRKYKRAKFFWNNCRSVEELAELLETEIGEGCDVNPEISSETKESEPLLSVETEPNI